MKNLFSSIFPTQGMQITCQFVNVDHLQKALLNYLHLQQNSSLQDQIELHQIISKIMNSKFQGKEMQNLNPHGKAQIVLCMVMMQELNNFIMNDLNRDIRYCNKIQDFINIRDIFTKTIDYLKDCKCNYNYLSSSFISIQNLTNYINNFTKKIIEKKRKEEIRIQENKKIKAINRLMNENKKLRQSQLKYQSVITQLQEELHHFKDNQHKIQQVLNKFNLVNPQQLADYIDKLDISKSIIIDQPSQTQIRQINSNNIVKFKELARSQSLIKSRQSNSVNKKSNRKQDIIFYGTIIILLYIFLLIIYY